MHLALTDLFLPSADWVSLVSEIVKVAIRKSRSVTENEDHFAYPSLETENNGEFPKLTNFVFTADCLVFIFDPYCLASYADGGWEVHIPYQSLKSILRPDSVVSEVIANKRRSTQKAKAFHF
jgi:IS4 transposase